MNVTKTHRRNSHHNEIERIKRGPVFKYHHPGNTGKDHHDENGKVKTQPEGDGVDHTRCVCMYGYKNKFSIFKTTIPPTRFELVSPDPKSCMIDRYTTGVLDDKTTNLTVSEFCSHVPFISISDLKKALSKFTFCIPTTYITIVNFLIN